MTCPHFADGDATLYVGDCREVLASLPEASARTCVTSPPYWGLRDYGVAGQLGAERTPAEYVANLVEVFRSVRRVLTKDGTLWLNLGDSYAGSWGAQGRQGKTGELAGRTARAARQVAAAQRRESGTGSLARTIGLKNKDLVGIPWSVAKALQEPYYAGRITAERDRAWLAAMVDGEGTICGFEHERGDGGGVRSGVHIFITNTSTLLLDEAHRVWPASRSEHSRPGDGHLGRLTTFRWLVHGAENKALFLREVYPYLIAKKKQARLAYALALLMVDAKRLGHSPQRDEVREKRSLLVRLMSQANHGEPVDVPSWCDEPPAAYEPGWYLRSDIIWAKPNPMPESVTDRPTKSHEYVFLLAKSERYFYDADAVKEAAKKGHAGSQFHTGKTAGHQLGRASDKPRQDDGKRNARTVWNIATQPSGVEHFATMPRALAQRCILAGSAHGDTVLDPFNGAGTTGLVAMQHGRRYLGCELNQRYADASVERWGRVQRALFAAGGGR